MATAPDTAPLMTAEDLLVLPDDGLRHELIDGELRTMSPASLEHGIVAATIGALLANFVKERGLGVVVGAETGFTLRRAPDTVRAPDAAFIRTDRVPPPGRRARFPELTPDLVVEVVSPSDTAAEVAEKAVAWLDAGARLVWVLYPAQRLAAVHRPDRTVTLLRGDAVLEGDAVLPGFSVPLPEPFD